MDKGNNPTHLTAENQNKESSQIEDKNQKTELLGVASSPLNDDIDLDDIASFNPHVPLTLEAQYQLAQDEEKPEPPPVAERGVPRMVTMLLLTGGAILLGLFVWQVIKPRSAIKPIAQSPSPETKAPLLQDEKPELLARLAYQDQQKLIAQKPKTNERRPVAPDSQAAPKPTPRRVIERRAPRAVAARPAPPPPAPRTIVRTVTVPAPNPKPAPAPAPRPIVRTAPTPTLKPTPAGEKIDPFERWNQLAQLGQTRGNVAPEDSLVAQNAPVPTSDDTPSPTSSSELTSTSEIQVSSIPVDDTTEENFGGRDRFLAVQKRSPKLLGDNTEESILSHPQPTADEGTPEFLTVSIGQEQSQEKQPASSHLSPGAIGILSRTPQSQIPPEIAQVALGTTAPATVSVPLLWDEGSGEQLYNRFAITLTDDLEATDGAVVFSKGTVMIAKADRVSQDNRMVQASAIAIVYADASGQVKQQEIPSGAVLIAGEDGEPLIAKGHLDSGDDIAKQDMLVGLLSGVGRVGEVFTEPRVRSRSSISSGGFSRDTIAVESREPQIWSAVLDGFFSPLAKRLERRSDRAVEELLSRPNIAMVPKGAKVSVTVNSFLNVSR